MVKRKRSNANFPEEQAKEKAGFLDSKIIEITSKEENAKQEYLDEDSDNPSSCLPTTNNHQVSTTVTTIRCSSRVNAIKALKKQTSDKDIPKNIIIASDHDKNLSANFINQTECQLEVDSTNKSDFKVSQKGNIRVSKKSKKNFSNESSSHLKKPISKSQLSNKTRRQWELWSVEDKNHFFDALNEYGKEFENIQSYIALKGKRKGIPSEMIKNKDQVRYFYYRTWHKISKYLNLSEDISKQTQEIYGLVNYAEFRKKGIGCFNEKNIQKLNELINTGSTIIKVKGKNIRIKTPVCRALKKINDIDNVENEELLKLPKEVNLDLRPSNNAAWLYVQKLSHNPRIRLKVVLQQRVKVLLEYLQRRWSPLHLKKREQLLATLPTSLDKPDPKENIPSLRIFPKKDCDIKLVTVSPISVPSYSSTNISLESYKKNCLAKTKDCLKSKKGMIKVKSKEGFLDTDQNTRHESDQNKSTEDDIENNKDVAEFVEILPSEEQICDNPEDEAHKSLRLLKTICQYENTNSKFPEEKKDDTLQNSPTFKPASKTSDQQSLMEDFYLSTQKGPNNLTLSQYLDLMKNSEEDKDCLDDGSQENETNNDTEDEVPVSAKIDCNYQEDEIRKGWTINNIAMLTIGELYIMLGSQEKLELEYDWDYSINDETDHGNDVVEMIVDKKFHKSLASYLKMLLRMSTSFVSDLKGKIVNNSNIQANDSTSNTCARNGANRSRIFGSRNTCRTVSTKSLSETATGFEVSESAEATNTESETEDKHVFVVPYGVGNQSNQQSSIAYGSLEEVRQQIDKMLPPIKTGRRTRKPLVVQRSLVPQGCNSKTLVHFVPPNPAGPSLLATSNTFSLNNINSTVLSSQPSPTSGLSSSIKTTTLFSNRHSPPTLSIPDETSNIPLIAEDSTINNEILISTKYPNEMSVPTMTLIGIGSECMETSEETNNTELKNQSNCLSSSGNFQNIGKVNETLLLNLGSCLSQTSPSDLPSTELRPPNSSSNQSWLNEATGDMSFSSLFDATIKDSSNSASIKGLKTEVDQSLSSLLTESSVDYIAKFAALADHVNKTSDIM